MVKLTNIDLDLTKRLKDEEFAREYVAMVEGDAAQQRERIMELEEQMRLIVRHHDMRAEIYSGDGKDAALAWVMANLARDVLDLPISDTK